MVILILFVIFSYVIFVLTLSIERLAQGYRNRYDIIDHEHEKKTFMYFFHRPIFAKIREFSTIVLLNGIERFSESTLNSS